MRLINVKTLTLKEFHHNIPPYAILSHTWGNEEVTFQEYQEHFHITNRCVCPGTIFFNSNIDKKAGFNKIVGACNRAKADGLTYLWCDTNCIDKTSSAELSEAINSMYAWYRDSAVCYAYLADVGVFDKAGRGAEEFRTSRWFTRGWTLQELLAPQKLVFFNENWVPIADRQQLAEIIHGATRIHIGALENRDSVPTYSIAQRMSWAAYRRTSRREDIAYCLLGLFGINMPLLYGEGSKAFTRLQEEIIKISDDESIFAWDFVGSQLQSPAGILAPSPKAFASCGSIVRDMSITRSPYSLTNLGVSIQVPVIKTFVHGTVLVGLNCSIELQAYNFQKDTKLEEPPFWHFPVWIWLRSLGHNIYTRSPNPVSRTSLAAFYPDGIDCNVTKLFGTTSVSKVDTKVSSIYSFTNTNSVASTGFLITMSFGRIRQRTRTFEAAFRPGDFTMHQIPSRGSPALSHEVISAGNYVVLLSIAWNQQQQPEYWHYAVFMSLNGVTISTISANHWEILFQVSCTPGGRSSRIEQLEHIHTRVRELSGQQSMTMDESSQPYVQMENNLWQDLNGQTKVVAHLTFREVTRAHYAS